MMCIGMTNYHKKEVSASIHCGALQSEGEWKKEMFRPVLPNRNITKLVIQHALNSKAMNWNDYINTSFDPN